MAAISPAHGDHTALTPPSSSHGEEVSWGHSRQQSEQTMHDKNSITRPEPPQQSPVLPQNGNPSASPFNSSFDAAARKMHSVDNLFGARWDKIGESGALSPPFEPKISRPSPSSDDLKRPIHQRSFSSLEEDNSKWIHRDKLAKIESQELQAAGIVIPRSRAPSKQRRERSTRRGTDASEQGQSRPRNDSAPIETMEAALAPVWDLRTPEEIAEEQETAYFIAQSSKGGSRIPVAKISPAPILVDHLERGVAGGRRPGDSPEAETITPTTTKTRSRSASSTLREGTPASGPRAGQRPVVDASPKKTAATGRKTSASSKASTVTGRPKTRSGPSKDSSSSSSGTRPPTRSGDATLGTKQLEGDPPWMINSYKPDPRLPPDQQIIPTVARRLQQEKWEKEGKFGDIYDKEFRPLNDNPLFKLSGLGDGPDLTLEMPKSDNEPTEEAKQNQDQSNEWPLKAEPIKSPTPRQGSSYSTMPKISDMPPKSPLPSPRTPVTTQAKQPQTQQKEKVQAPTRVPSVPDEEEKKGCGCCVVM